MRKFFAIGFVVVCVSILALSGCEDATKKAVGDAKEALTDLLGN